LLLFKIEYCYVRNLHGDIIGLVDTNGTQVVSYTYDSWGKLISIDGSLKDTLGVKNPYRYRGYRYDNETGLYYLQSRYYNPETCRMLNADGIAGTTGELLSGNMYSYCASNPINRQDPSGFFWWDILDFGLAAWSWSDFISKPTWTGLGMALLDTVGCLPAIPSTGYITRGARLAENAGDVINVASKSKVSKGWKVGEPIDNLTKAGNKPSWSTVRTRYWKNEAKLNASSYSAKELTRMQKGRAPLVASPFNGKLYSMELHHVNPRRLGGSDTYDNLMKVTPWDHASIDPFRQFKP